MKARPGTPSEREHVTDLRDMLLHLANSQKVENERLRPPSAPPIAKQDNSLPSKSAVRLKTAKSPLDKIAGAVQTASGDQSGMVQNMLQDV